MGQYRCGTGAALSTAEVAEIADIPILERTVVQEEEPSQERKMPAIGSYSATQWTGPVGGAETARDIPSGLLAIHCFSAVVNERGTCAPSG